MKVVLASADNEGRKGTETVVTALPVWGRIQIVEALTGLPDGRIRELVNDGLVRARKSGLEKRSACVFRVQDVLDWLENDAVKPDRFRTPADAMTAAEGGAS